MFSIASMPTVTSVLSAYSTLAASAMLVRTMVTEVRNLVVEFIPQNLQDRYIQALGSRFCHLTPLLTIVIDECSGFSINEIYQASEIYLRTKINTPSVVRLSVCKSAKEKGLSVTMGRDQEIIDDFQGIQLRWKQVCIAPPQNSVVNQEHFSNNPAEHKSFELIFHKKHKEMILSAYLPYVVEKSRSIIRENKVIKLHSHGNYYGDGTNGSINLDHPSTFDTLAMEPVLKKELIDDLDRFVQRRELYRRVGKAWKRGYLLYGPPGTGKSSLIAAMANYLKFDIYDLELASLRCNSDLRRLLVGTANQSILVIEDIDCSVELEDRQDIGNYESGDTKLTLSGLLNFIDGLWSCCGDGRIIVFTTNHKDRLDPSLLRPGRMDMHIHMSFCTPCGFKILAKNYLGLQNHCLFREIEKLIMEVDVTPAEVAEELLKRDDAQIVLEGLIRFLQRKKTKRDESNAGGERVLGNDEETKRQKIEECDGKKVEKHKTKTKRTRNKRQYSKN